MTGLSNMLDP